VSKLSVLGLMCALAACEHEPTSTPRTDAGVDAFRGTLEIPVGAHCTSGLLCDYGFGVCFEGTCRYQCRFDEEPADWWRGCPRDQEAYRYTWPDGAAQCICLP
jgi:hypothetical protein